MIARNCNALFAMVLRLSLRVLMFNISLSDNCQPFERSHVSGALVVLISTCGGRNIGASRAVTWPVKMLLPQRACVNPKYQWF
jgi:hypothetical protein